MSKSSVHPAYQTAISFIQYITPKIDKFNQEDKNYHVTVSSDVDVAHKDYERVNIYVHCIDAAHGAAEDLKFDLDVGGRTIKRLLGLPAGLGLEGFRDILLSQQAVILEAIQSWRADQYKLDTIEEGEL